MSKHTLILVPGSFAFPEFYTNITDAVTAAGYEIQALHLPSVGRKTDPIKPPGTMYDDAEFIANAVRKIADQGKDVILFPHSYGGIPTSQSTKGVTKAEREKSGQKGGVVRIAYMTSVVPALGKTSQDVLGEVSEEQSLKWALEVDEHGWMHHSRPDVTAKLCFNDLPEDEGIAWVEKFGKHSGPSFQNELTYEGYKDMPVSYLVCENDLCIPPEIQRKGIEMIEEVSGRKVDVTSINADHVPVAGPKAQEVIDWFISVAEKASN